MVAADHSAIATPATGIATQRRPGLIDEVNPLSGSSPRVFAITNAIQPLSIGLLACGPRIRDIHSSPWCPLHLSRLLPIDSKDGQSWLTNPSTSRRLGDGHAEKAPSPTINVPKLPSINDFAARFWRPCQPHDAAGTSSGRGLARAVKEKKPVEWLHPVHLRFPNPESLAAII